MFYTQEINGKKFLKSNILKAEHLFTTRDSFIKTKDPEFDTVIKQNKELLKTYLGVEKLVSPSQTHTSNIEIADINKTVYPDTDGLIVKDTNFAIFLNFADCTPVIIYDNKHHIGAISHAGWRGTANQISAKTVKMMVEKFGSHPEDITAVIGPAISLCCYNVGTEVLEQLKKTVKDFDGLSQIRNEKIYVDLKGINRQQLIECGVSEIDVCPYCTCCNNDLFFSYRKENATTNRHSAILKI